MTTIDYETIGRRLQKRRKQIGYTQEDLSEKVGLASSYISKIENGHIKISLDILSILIEALDMDLNYVLCGVDMNKFSPKLLQFCEFYININENKKEDLDDFLDQIITLCN